MGTRAADAAHSDNASSSTAPIAPRGQRLATYRSGINAAEVAGARSIGARLVRRSARPRFDMHRTRDPRAESRARKEQNPCALYLHAFWQRLLGGWRWYPAPARPRSNCIWLCSASRLAGRLSCSLQWFGQISMFCLRFAFRFSSGLRYPAAATSSSRSTSFNTARRLS